MMTILSSWGETMYVSKNLRIILVWPMVDSYINIYYQSFYFISNYKKKILLTAFKNEII